MPTTPFNALTEQGKARRQRQTATLALTEYGLESASFTQIAIDTNFVFRVRSGDGSRYALRVHRQTDDGLHFHDLGDTELECWWVQRLVADGLPVADVVPNRRGQLITTIDDVPGVPGPQRCVLFEWLPGRQPDGEESWFWPELGRLAARLHEHAAELTLPPHANLRRWDSVFPYEPSELGQGDYASDRYEGLLSAEQWETLRQGRAVLDPYLAGLYQDPNRPARLIHGDLHDENVQSYRRKLSAFDFEDVILGHPENDLAITLYGPYYNHPNFAGVVTAMRSGYEEIAPWPVAAVDELRPLFAARALGLVNFCLTLGADYVSYVSMLTDRVADYLNNPTR